MTIKEYKKIFALLKTVYREVENEAIAQGINLLSPEYDELLRKAKEAILNKSGFTLEQYEAVEAKAESISNDAVFSQMEDTKKRLNEIEKTNFFTKDDIIKISHEVAKEYIKPPEIINKIVKEITVEKPTIIKETKIEQIVNKVEFDDKPIKMELARALQQLNEIKIPEQIDLEKLKKDLRNDFGMMFEKNINTLDMPNWRKLAMGLQGQIDSLSSGSASSSLAHTHLFVGNASNIAEDTGTALTFNNNILSIFRGVTLGTTGTVAGTAFFKGSISGTLSLTVSAQVTSWTMTLPAAAPAGNEYALVGTTAGVTSWLKVPNIPNDATANRIAFWTDANTLGDDGGLTFHQTTREATILRTGYSGVATVGLISNTTTLGVDAIAHYVTGGTITVINGIVDAGGTPQLKLYWNDSDTGAGTQFTGDDTGANLNYTDGTMTGDFTFLDTHTEMAFDDGTNDRRVRIDSTGVRIMKDATYYYLPDGAVGTAKYYFTQGDGTQFRYRFSYQAKTANYTLATGDNFVDCTANSFDITLPTAVGVAGQDYLIINSGTGVITIKTTSSQTISGQASGSITLNQGETLHVLSNDVNWIRKS